MRTQLVYTSPPLHEDLNPLLVETPRSGKRKSLVPSSLVALLRAAMFLASISIVQQNVPHSPTSWVHKETLHSLSCTGKSILVHCCGLIVCLKPLQPVVNKLVLLRFSGFNSVLIAIEEPLDSLNVVGQAC